MGASMEAVAVVSYEAKGHIIVRDGGWNLGRKIPISGQAPAISPSRDKIAFLRKGNIFLIHGKNGSITQITRDEPAINQQTNELSGLRVSWHPSAKIVAYTRILPYKISKSSKTIQPLPVNTKLLNNTIYLSTIWLADIKTGKCSRIVGPMGDIRRMIATYQIEGAEVCEPMFSPNGKFLWFLNGGALYEIRINAGAAKAAGKPVLVARTGDGLDFGSQGASKSGSGAQQMAWDAKHSRLCYWIGRFWGSGTSEYGYISWRNGKWGRPVKWKPGFAPAIQKDIENTIGCAVDDRGWLWVLAFVGDDIRWMREDASYKLPVDADRPDWGPLIY